MLSYAHSLLKRDQCDFIMRTGAPLVWSLIRRGQEGEERFMQGWSGHFRLHALIAGSQTMNK